MNKTELVKGIAKELYNSEEAYGDINAVSSKNNYEDVSEIIVNKFFTHCFSNSDTLLVAETLLKYDYNPLMGGKWALCEKGSNMTIITRDTKEELFNYVTTHYC